MVSCRTYRRWQLPNLEWLNVCGSCSCPEEASIDLSSHDASIESLHCWFLVKQPWWASCEFFVQFHAWSQKFPCILAACEQFNDQLWQLWQSMCTQIISIEVDEHVRCIFIKSTVHIEKIECLFWKQGIVSLKQPFSRLLWFLTFISRTRRNCCHDYFVSRQPRLWKHPWKEQHIQEN